MKGILAFVSVLLVVVLAVLFWPSDSDELDKAIEAAVEQQAQPENKEMLLKSQGLDMPATDEVAEQMRAEYEVVEARRKELNKQLNRMKHEIWGVKLPPDQAKKVNNALMGGFKYLKYPPKLGAFSGVEGVKAETAKVEFLLKDIDEARGLLRKNEGVKEG